MQSDHNIQIAVLGGSFNPPTIAHYKLMLHVIKHTGASKGVFVPSSSAYVTRKATRANTPVIFTETDRLKMLELMCDRNDLTISTCEFGDSTSGRSYETMLDVQREHPGMNCAFVIGADKLRILPRWHNIGAFMDRFKFIVLTRGNDNPDDIIRANNFLTHNRDRLIIIPDLTGYDDVSSSACQKLMQAGDMFNARKMLHPKVAKYLREIKTRKD